MFAQQHANTDESVLDLIHYYRIELKEVTVVRYQKRELNIDNQVIKH